MRMRVELLPFSVLAASPEEGRVVGGLLTAAVARTHKEILTWGVAAASPPANRGRGGSEERGLHG